MNRTRVGLPPLLTGKRRWWLAALVGLGLGQAVLGMVMAWAMIELQGSGSVDATRWAVVTIVIAAFTVGALRVQERVVAEKLGQHYVREMRQELLRSALTPGDASSLGVTVARTTNDLTSVRNWIAQGIAPMVVAGPLLGGVLVALALLDPRLAIAGAAPLLVLLAGVAAWAGEAYDKSRALRRTRGAMASRIAETVTASSTILAAGGGERELRNLDKVSKRVVDRAVDRAGTLGLIRSAGVVASTLLGVLVAAVGVVGDLPAGVVVAAMAVAGIAAAPIMDLGRVVEFRQSFLAAKAILDPTLRKAAERRAAQEEHRARAAAITPDEGTDVRIALPELMQMPLVSRGRGRYALSGSENATRAAITRIMGLAVPAGDITDQVHVGGLNLARMDAQDMRRCVGLAQSGAAFERGHVLRAARYRRPDLDADDAKRLLDAVGLHETRLPDGHRTRLRRGGEPLNRDQRARLSLARALYGEPGLIIVDGLEADLAPEGREMLVRLLRQQHGTVLLIGCPHTAEALSAETVPVVQRTVHDEANVNVNPGAAPRLREGAAV